MVVEKKTLLLVAPYFPPHGGGLERYAFEISKRLARRGWRIVVVTSHDGRRTSIIEQVQDLKVYRLPYQFKISNTPFSFKWFSQIRRIIRDERPDILNVHTPVAGIGDIAAFFSRVPLMVTYHSGSMRKGKWVDVFVAFYELFILPHMLRKAAHIVCSSDSVRFGFLKKYLHKSSTIAPAVDHELFKPSPRSGVPRILFVASDLTNATRYKGLATLLEAFSGLTERGIAADLDVVGDGDMRAAYEKTARELGIGEHVTFHGRLDGEKLAAVYRAASVFALPTSNDSYPLVVLEALASGLPVIATRVGDIPKIVQDGVDGYLIESKDVDALTEKLVALCTNSELREQMGLEGRDRIIREANWDERANQYHQLLNQSMDTPRPYIVQVAGYYPPHVGGIERVVSTATKMLVDKGHGVTVITSGGGATERSDNLVVKRLSTIEFAHTPFAPTLLFHLLTLPRKSIIHLHLAQAYWPEMVRLAAWIRRIPYIAHYHLEVKPSGFFGPLFIKYKRITWGPTLRGARAAIACSEAQKEWIHTKYGVPIDRINVIPNAVNDSFFAAPRELQKKDTLRILTIGRLTVQKRVDRIVDACALLRIPYSLTIVGDGEERKKLETRAKEKNVLAVFLGNKGDTEMQALHKSHDIFVTATEREGGTPLVVLEAFAAGLPVIASNVSGVKELVGESGLLVDTQPKNFARAIMELTQNTALYKALSERGIQKAHSHTWPQYIRSLESVYAIVNSAKIDELQGAGKATPEAYRAYDEGDAGDPQRSRSRFLPNSRI